MSHTIISATFYEAFGLLGKRWTGLIIAALLSGPQHFSELAERIPGMAEPMLSTRLKELVRAGIVQRQVHAEIPVRIEYELTEKGYALKEVFQQMHEWADEWAIERSVSQ